MLDSTSQDLDLEEFVKDINFQDVNETADSMLPVRSCLRITDRELERRADKFVQYAVRWNKSEKDKVLLQTIRNLGKGIGNLRKKYNWQRSDFAEHTDIDEQDLFLLEHGLLCPTNTVKIVSTLACNLPVPDVRNGLLDLVLKSNQELVERLVTHVQGGNNQSSICVGEVMDYLNVHIHQSIRETNDVDESILTVESIVGDAEDLLSWDAVNNYELP